MTDDQQEPDAEQEEGAEDPPSSEGRPLLSYRAAMWAYAVLAVLCLATLHGDALYLALLIIGALAIKTWLAEAKSKLE
jgi:hypothetical protein